ncbi:disks large homolog 5 isoform X1 [Eupeodes corollae]|uniref:disks large homolog 5 isoform X1 n=1 Tax=Eupeodes corollae TaxID=290404 RepID=UPI00248F92B4|nr:disks large homolog 5 isoform X1 [Eupeodes corollae]
MASGDLSLTSNSSQEESAEYVVGYDRTLRPSSNSSGSTTAANLANNNPNAKKSFELMKQQYDMELNNLRHQHKDTVRRCEEMGSQLAFYQEQYMAAMKQLESSSKDRNKFTDIAAENARLTQQNMILERKLLQFIESVKQKESENGNTQSGSFYCEHYSEMGGKKCEGGCVETEKLLEELQLCKERYADLSKDRNIISAEREKFKKHLSSVINELDNVKKERNYYRDARETFSIQRDQLEKEVEKLKAVLASKANELLMATMHRNRVEDELNQILSEKDNVLQETQKMSDDLAAVKKELDQVEIQRKKDKSDIKSLQQANSELMHNIEDLNMKLKKRELLKSRESSWSKEFSDSKDDFKEIEKLRKCLEKAHSEVEKSIQETDIAKRHRDWAISEREKIVQERDSVKTLCDNLRKERDKAISDLLSAIRDSEKIKKQKDEAQREIEGLKEQIENSHSHDLRRSFRLSTYDADDMIEIELCNYHQDGDVGIILDDTNNRQLVCGVTNTSPAFGHLKINDVIVKVNNLDCQSMTKRMVLDEVRSSAPRCSLLVSRTRQSKRHFYTVHLNLQENHNHGLNLDTGVFISKIEQNSLAAFEPELDVGDRVLSINNKSMEGVQNVKEVMNILNDLRNDSITIFALKNVQDVSYPDAHRRMTTTSAQTDSNDSMHKVPSAKHPSKIAEMLSKFREKIHISKPGADFSQENDALAALDSVLSESSEKSKENLFKRSKRSSKKDKETSKSMGTWPRTNILNTSQENPTGTIVQHRKKERAPLSLFTAAPINVDKEEPEKMGGAGSSSTLISSKNNPNRNSNPIPASSLFQSTGSSTTNGYPYRHSVYGTALESEPIILEQSKPVGIRSPPLVAPNMRNKTSDLMGKYSTHTNQRQHHANHYQNRYSLNLTPMENSLLYKTTGQTAQQQVIPAAITVGTKQQQLFEMIKSPPPQPPLFCQPQSNSTAFARNSAQQNSLDMISLKSQNSIDSILSQKSPPISEYANFPKRPAAPVVGMQSKNVSKYPSDSESIASGVANHPGMHAGGALLFHRDQMNNGGSIAPQHRHTQLFPTFTSNSSQMHPIHIPHSHHPHKIRHSSPLTLPHSIDPQHAAHSSADKFDMDYGSPPPLPHHAYNSSVDYPYNRGGRSIHPTRDHDDMQSGYSQVYEGGTFPRKKEHQRLRIPSNHSVASKGSGVKNSTGSIDHHGGSERGSPMPQVHVEVLSHGGSKRNSNVPSDFLCPGDLRRVTIEKSDKSLGITIQCNNNGGGIFVSTVAEKSIATRAGLQVGDQLLEVCGLNMRSATNDIAANVLRQCGNSITMLVQYNPEKFLSAEYDGGNNLEPESVNHSGSPTPRNSPRPPVRSLIASSPITTSSALTNSSIMPPSNTLISTPIKDQSFADSLENQSDVSSQDIPTTIYEEEARYVTLHMDKSKNLGIKLFGGNKVGIFVHDVTVGSPSDRAGIRKGDQILEYNGVDLRCVTAEQAANEISKLTETVTMLVQNKLQILKQIKDRSGDSFYIRVGFDRTGDLNEGEIKFVKDEVLYVDNTVFGGTFGLWRAWKLDAKGHRKECGIIPSQSKVEEELRSGETVDCDGGTARRGSTSARRSFFRRKKHQRSSSRDSTEIASFSNTQLSFFPDSGMLNDDGGILSYQRVERLDSPIRRPVLIIGPLSECVMDRLTIDFVNLFKSCEVTTMDCSQEAMEEGLQENIFVDYRRRGNKFECTTVESINNSCKNDRRHCILDISISAVERLQRLQIYPIVLLLRFKSAKQIREIKDPRYGTDKISAKAAKEMYERALKLESDYKQYISAVIPGVSIKHMCTQIKDSVDKEQDKLLWVPVSNA